MLWMFCIRGVRRVWLLPSECEQKFFVLDLPFLYYMNELIYGGVSRGLRSFLISIAVAGVLPLIESIGIVWTNVISAALAWVSFVYV